MGDDDAANSISSENNKSVLCVGMCVLDIIHVCTTFPEEDSDKRCKHGRWQRGGNASNNCTVLTQLGTKCEYLGTLSSTKMFQFVIDDMTERKIEYRHCVYYDCEPPLSSILLNESNGSRTIIHSNPNMPILKYEDFRKINLSDYRWVHFEARNPEETSKMMQMIVDWNNERDPSNRITISLDIEKHRLDNISLANFADVVFLGKDLAVHLGYTSKSEAVYKFRQLTRTGNIIICPWGADGVAALDSSDGFCASKAYTPEIVVDSLGAGDTFAAAVIFALIQSLSVDNAIQFACQLAGAKIGFLGFDGISKCFKNFL